MKLHIILLLLFLSLSSFGKCVGLARDAMSADCYNYDTAYDCDNPPNPQAKCLWLKKETGANSEQVCRISDDQKYATCENGIRYVIDTDAIHQINRNLHNNKLPSNIARPPLGDGTGGDGDER